MHNVHQVIQNEFELMNSQMDGTPVGTQLLLEPDIHWPWHKQISYVADLGLNVRPIIYILRVTKLHMINPKKYIW